MSRDVTRTVVRNAFFNVVGRAWFLLLSLALTPYLLGGLGKESYGVWVLVDSLVRTIALLDFGFGTSFVKFVAEYDARGERERVFGVLTAGLAFYALIGAALTAVAVFGVDPLLRFFTVPSDLAAETRTTLRIAIAACVCANLMSVYQSVINGLQRMGTTNAIMTGLSVFWFGACIAVVQGGYGIRGLATAQLATQVVGIAASIVLATRLYPGLRLSIAGTRGVLRRLFAYGLNVHVGNVAALVSSHFDKLLVNRFLDASHVAYYDVGARPPGTARSFAVLLVSALTPATSEIEVREGRDALYDLFRRAARVIALLVLPLFFGIAVCGTVLVQAWVGPGYESSAVVLILLCVGTLAASLAAPVLPMVQGMGWPQCQRNAEALSLATNLVLSTALVASFGFYGAAVGTTTAMTVAAVYYLVAFHRFIERPLGHFLRDAWLRPALASLAAALLTGAVHVFLLPAPGDSRLTALLELVALALVFGAAYGLLVLASGQLDSTERAAIAKLVGRARSRRSDGADNQEK